MSNTYRHNKKAKYKKIPRDNQKRWDLYNEVHGHNSHNKENPISKKITRKKYRSKETRILNNLNSYEELVFPLDLGTQGWNTN